RSAKCDLAVIAAAKALQDELMRPQSVPQTTDAPLAEEARAVQAYKKATLVVFGTAMQTYGHKLADQQEVLLHLADMLMTTFSAESALLRATAASAQASPRAPLHVDAARVFVNDAAMQIETSARQALAAMTEGDTLRTLLAALRRLIKVVPINTAAVRRRLADE